MKPARLPGVDALKAVACLLIVGHHLAFYGPMSDVVHRAVPALIEALYDHGRLAVQVFLVVGGFLAAASLAPQRAAAFGSPWRMVCARYRRLVPPLAVAVAAAVLAAALVRPWLLHDSVPAAPTAWQLLVHLFLLQDLVGQDALSAGLWYVAIDLQLFALAVLLLDLVRDARHRWLVLALAAASLLVFNRQPALDATGLYFFGAYGLGMVAWWAGRSSRRHGWLLIAALGTAALLVDFRERLLVAMLVALGLVWLQRQAASTSRPQPAWIGALSRRSYSVFLIHFPVCLLVTAMVTRWWPASVAANALGMAAAFGLSLLAGAGLYRWVEAPTAPWRGVVRPWLGRLAA